MGKLSIQLRTGRSFRFGNGACSRLAIRVATRVIFFSLGFIDLKVNPEGNGDTMLHSFLLNESDPIFSA